MGIVEKVFKTSVLILNRWSPSSPIDGKPSESRHEMLARRHITCILQGDMGQFAWDDMVYVVQPLEKLLR